MFSPTPCDALSLFSGGLDSILAAKTLVRQGLSVVALHFVTPFFGYPEKVPRWEELYGLPFRVVDLGQRFVDMLTDRPPHGIGKVLNPCIDCKIMMLQTAKALLPEHGARFLVSGEVWGQRPMSQRPDALNTISREARVRDILLRPLSAKHLPETPMETSGLVDRSRLHDFHGRARDRQIALARELGVTEFPQPAGGCRLAEKEAAGRYYRLFTEVARPQARDMSLAGQGRQFWSGSHWLSVGRDQESNERMRLLAEPDDYQFNLVDLPGPLALGRPYGAAEHGWPDEVVRAAASLAASYAPKAVRLGGPVGVSVERRGKREVLEIVPDRSPLPGFAEPLWEACQATRIERFGSAG